MEPASVQYTICSEFQKRYIDSMLHPLFHLHELLLHVILAVSLALNLMKVFLV